MFGYINNATIKNVVLGAGNIVAGNKIGGIVGYAYMSNIDNVINNGTTVYAKTTCTEKGKWNTN